MKITIESTSRIVQIERQGVFMPGRIWEGKTESGIYVQCVITRIAAPSSEDLSQFDRELQEQIDPRRDDVFPLRMVI